MALDQQDHMTRGEEKEEEEKEEEEKEKGMVCWQTSSPDDKPLTNPTDVHPTR